jgi:hypothetical protein
MSHARGIEPGDRITLNERAREWTRRKIFTVTGVRSWGVVCHTQLDPARVVSSGPRTLEDGTAPYRANWNQIEQRLMTREEHRQRHRLLHRELDELLGDYLQHNPGTDLDTTLWRLIAWSYGQTVEPTELAK